MTHEEIERGEVIERYLLRKLTPHEEAEFEEHYLSCSECRERQVAERPVLWMIQKACEASARATREPRSLSMSAPAWGLAAALGAAAVYVSVVLPPKGTVVQTAAVRLPVVELTVYRASESVAGRARASQPFVLRLDGRGLPVGSDYAVAIVTESGGQIWKESAVRLEAEKAEVRVTQGLAAGLYFVRLVSGERILREYALRIDPEDSATGR